MSNTVDSFSVVLRDFMIGALNLPTKLLASRPSLKLKFSSKDAKLHKHMDISTNSEDGIWMGKGGVRVSSTAGDLRVSVLIEDGDLTTELCNSTVNCIVLAKHVRERPKDPYEIILDDDRSSALLFITCMTKTTPRDVTISNRKATSVCDLVLGDPKSSSSMRNTARSYYNLSRPPNPTSSAQISPECLELEHFYERTRNMPLENRAISLNAIGNEYLGLVERIHSAVILDRAISILDEAVQYSFHFDHRRGKYLANLSNALFIYFERTSDLAALDGAMAASQDAVLITDKRNRYKPHALNVYGRTLMTRYSRFGHMKDLQLAITQYEEAFELEPDLTLNNLAMALIMRFDRLRNLQDLETAICHLLKAIKIAPNDDTYKPSILNSLGGAFRARFESLGRIEDLEASVNHFQMASKLIPDNHSYKPAILSNLGHAFQMRFDRLSRIEDIEVAVYYKQTAVELTPADHPDKRRRLECLAGAFKRRFDCLGRIEDIEGAVHRMQITLELTPDDHPEKPAMLNSLGNVLETRFIRLDRIEDIEAAIDRKQTAVMLTPDNHPEKPGYLKALGNAFEVRFNRLGRIEDIEVAICYKQTALELTPDGHPDKPSVLNHLGNAFEARFNRLGNFEDLEASIHHKRLAVKLAPNGHSDKPAYLCNLANSLDTRFSRLQRPVDIEASLSHRRMVVELTPEGHANRPGHLASLATTLMLRCLYLLDDVKDFEESIVIHRTALKLLPEGHPHKPNLLSNLGVVFYARYRRIEQKGDLEEAYKCSSSVANLVSAPPAKRLQEARRWANRSVELGLPPLPAYQVAIDMLPRVAWLGLPIHGQHSLLEEVGEVVRDAIGAAIESEEYELAVEWAEAGRSIAWQNFLNLRSPLDELRSAHPELAARLHAISRQLEVTGYAQASEQNQGNLKGRDTEARSLTLLGLDWDKTVGEIRIKSGFESFLRTKRFNQLAPVAREGPVVILNAQDKGCTALLLIPEEGVDVYTTSISLPDFCLQESQMLHSNLMKVLTAERVRDWDEHDREDRKGYRLKGKHVNDGTLEDILKTIWVKVVAPVIEALAYQPRTTDLPRIWWCATGPLAFLPIHAAGIYDAEHEEAGHKLSDYVVSSYTLTLSALLDDSVPNSNDIKLLAVAQAEAPGASRIPNTEVEVERIERIVGNVSFTSLMKKDATIERVLEGMEKSNWVHLACHGKQDAKQPMKSGLLLHDGKLELEKLISTRFPNAEFAFLSACQTATGDEKVAEESVHLAAGMLFSGYKGVVATRWSIDDNIAPQIAEDVYRYMLGDGKPDGKRAAHALHYAVKRLREENKADVLTWVPFIHIGR